MPRLKIRIFPVCSSMKSRPVPVTGIGHGDRVGQAGGDLLQFGDFGGDTARGQFGGTARLNLCLGECVRERAKAK